VHQVVVSMQANARTPVAHTKGRSEVRGGGRKPWRQKGTGRARHGSRRSPIWRGGGITFGPTKERNFQKKINKKMKTKALYTVLSEKLRDKEILFLDKLSLGEIKTKYAKEILKNLSTIPDFKILVSKRKNAALIFMSHKDENILKSFQNFGNIEVGEARNMNLLDILNHKFIVIVDPQEGISFLENKISKKEDREIPANETKTGVRQAEKAGKKGDKSKKSSAKSKIPTTKKLAPNTKAKLSTGREASAKGGSVSGRKSPDGVAIEDPRQSRD